MLRRKTEKKIFLLLSVFILITDVAFVLVNYKNFKDVLVAEINHESRQSYDQFKIFFENVKENVMQLAVFVASKPFVTKIFEKGVHAVGRGDEKTANKQRKILHNLFKAGYEIMSQEYNVNRIQFHHGPGDKGFYRVHDENRFGDDLSDIRHLSFDAIKESKVTAGFEIGRSHAGIRGIAPIFHSSDNKKNKSTSAIGAVEFGSSFQPIVNKLHKLTGSHFSVLLSKKYLKSILWKKSFDKILREKYSNKEFVVEATSDPMTFDILRSGNVSKIPQKLETEIIYVNDIPFSHTVIPLRDYIGEKYPDRTPVGVIMICKDITKLMSEFENSINMNTVYAVLSYILLEILLFFGIKYTCKALNTVIADQTANLETANANLKEKNSMLESFANTVSHDLKNPLTGILGFTSIVTKIVKNKYMKKKDFQSEEIQEEILTYMSKIYKNSNKMENLINTMLAYAKAGQENIKFEECSLSSILIEAKDQVSFLVKQKLAILDFPEDDFIFHANRPLVVQVFANLFSNSLKYCDDSLRPIIQVEAEFKNKDEFVVTVMDNGIGIAEDQLPYIFQEFRRAHDSTTFSAEGFGLGMATVKKILDMHDSQIEIRSMLGKGSEFIITFKRHLDDIV